jgi:hypothetical protein
LHGDLRKQRIAPPLSAIPVRTLWKSPHHFLPNIFLSSQPDVQTRTHRDLPFTLSPSRPPLKHPHPNAQLFPPLHQSYGIDPSTTAAYLYLHEFKKFSAAPRPPMKTTVSKNDVLKKKQIPDDLNQPNSNSNNDWQTYRTRFTVRARTLTAPLSFVDALGREQSGKRGDYLVESNGMVTITSRHIFEDVYVALDPSQISAETIGGGRREQNSGGPPRKSPISTKKSGFFSASRRRSL